MNNDRNKNKKKKTPTHGLINIQEGAWVVGAPHLQVKRKGRRKEAVASLCHQTDSTHPDPPTILHHTHSYTPLVVRLRVKGSAAGLLDIG